jgi:hypothetical protein
MRKDENPNWIGNGKGKKVNWKSEWEGKFVVTKKEEKKSEGKLVSWWVFLLFPWEWVLSSDADRSSSRKICEKEKERERETIGEFNIKKLYGKNIII